MNCKVFGCASKQDLDKRLSVLMTDHRQIYVLSLHFIKQGRTGIASPEDESTDFHPSAKDRKHWLPSCSRPFGKPRPCSC